MRESNNPVMRILFWVIVALIFVYTLFPFYWAINTSLKTETELFRTPATLFADNPTLGNYAAVFSNTTFLRGLLNSFIVAASTTFLALMFGSFAAYALGKLRFRGKEVTLYLILAMTLFPAISILSSLYNIIRALQLNALVAMIVTYLVFTLPFTIWVLTSFFRALPGELLQAAEVDGASPFQAFHMILLPLTAPALVTTGLLAFIGAWNEYLFALTYTATQPEWRTVPVAIALFSGQISRQEPFGEIMAGAVIVTIPLIILVLVFQRRIVEGLTAGAVKG